MSSLPRTPADPQPGTEFEEPGQDESGKTAAPQSAQGSKESRKQAQGGKPTREPAKENAGDDDASEGT